MQQVIEAIVAENQLLLRRNGVEDSTDTSPEQAEKPSDISAMTQRITLRAATRFLDLSVALGRTAAITNRRKCRERTLKHSRISTIRKPLAREKCVMSFTISLA